jgi:hypothetical protein
MNTNYYFLENYCGVRPEVQLLLIFSFSENLRVADYMKNEILLERTLIQNLAWAKLGKKSGLG